MTGLNLETFLQLLRVAPGAWASLGVAMVILALMTWTSWGSRRVLRKCLFLSITAHIVLVFYGGSSPEIQRLFRLGRQRPRSEPAIERIKVTSIHDPALPDPDAVANPGKSAFKPVSAWDRDGGALALAGTNRTLPRPERVDSSAASQLEPPKATAEGLTGPTAAPELGAIEPSATEATARITDPATAATQAIDPITDVVAPGEGVTASAPEPTPAVEAASTPALPLAGPDLRSRSRPRSQPTPPPDRAIPGPANAGPPPLPVATPTPTPIPERDLVAPAAPSPGAEPAGQAGAAPPPPDPDLPDLVPTLDDPVAGLTSTPDPSAPAATTPDPAPRLLPEIDIRRSVRPGRPPGGTNPTPAPIRAPALERGSPVGSLAQVTPSITSAIPNLPRATGRRPLAEVPPVYRSRLDPNRTALAQRSGASLASEQAVEHALAWLAKHQDPDGRWDGGTVKYRDGHVADTDDTYTVHCPPADVCFGECYYGEADTALTGLSLLAYLGAGYTHLDGKYAEAVGRGIDFLRRSQKANGDLRGSSLEVGMYCHAMATLALCEAYALTGDSTLRAPVEKGVAFLVQSRAADGMAWRYAPGASTGDTSILGWVVMALKSAKTVGIPIPPPVQTGIKTWLERVSTGRSGGLAEYQPTGGTKVTPTMTAEAWACRQFLELGGPGPASDEAAASLLKNPSDPAKKFNVYYLYYGTLAMYQHGGAAWSTWNARVRDEVVSRQQTQGHRTGSWDPDDSPYGTHGGRIYSTALATLTLEVYYRFLRLYSPSAPPTPLAPRPTDTGARRAGLDPLRAPAGR